MNKAVKVEIVKTADIEQLKDLYKDVGWWSENDDKDPEFINKLIQGSFCFAVASINDKVIGTGRSISDGVCDAYIQDVVVLNELRGRGIGVLIMEELIKHLKSKNINWISLISEPKAGSFYKKCGFVQMPDFIPFTLK